MMKRFIVWVGFFLIVSGCQRKTEYHKFSGETMGTYYAITYEGQHLAQTSKEVDQLLIDFNQSLSTYIPTALISQLNESEQGITLPPTDTFFQPVLEKAKTLEEMTDGKLNTAIMPLLNYWRDSSTSIDTNEVERLLSIVKNSDFTIVDRAGDKYISKSLPEARLDFSSLAKGYGIDVIAQYFTQKGVENYLIDIGGEARGYGYNSIGQPWTLAINTPREGSGLRDVELLIQLKNSAIATSGTYRQFYEKGGKKVAHIMDPIQGYSTTSDILSASVVSEDCMTADGLATALMVMSLDEAKVFLENTKIKACLIYDEDGRPPLERYYSGGFESFVVEP